MAGDVDTIQLLKNSFADPLGGKLCSRVVPTGSERTTVVNVGLKQIRSASLITDEYLRPGTCTLGPRADREEDKDRSSSGGRTLVQISLRVHGTVF